MEGNQENSEYWYVLFVYNDKEHKIVEDMSKHFEGHPIFPFVPTQRAIFIRRGVRKLEKELLYPGYVIVSSKLCSDKFLKLVESFVSTHSDIIRILRNTHDSKSGITVVGEVNRQKLLQLMNKENCIEISSGFIENDQVYIESGPLVGFEGIITKINRHKRQATIALDIFGIKVPTTVALEIVRRDG